MAVKGAHKAARLLMNLDPATAAELLKSASPEIIKQIAAEVAYLQTAGYSRPQAAGDPVREFFGLLGKRAADLQRADFLKKLLDNTMGEQESRQVMLEIQALVQARDPFLAVRSAGAAELRDALDGESPQTVALVLSQLPARKSAQLLSLLDEQVRGRAVYVMMAGESVSAEARLRVARVVSERLKTVSRSEVPVSGQAQQEEKFRRVAVLLRVLEPAAREPLLSFIGEKDREAAEAVRAAMFIWQDVLVVADRSLQDALRGMEARRLALALFEADEATIAKVRANVSERVNTMVAEEQSLLSSPKPDDVRHAREDVLQALREMNDRGELNFQEE